MLLHLKTKKILAYDDAYALLRISSQRRIISQETQNNLTLSQTFLE